MRFFPALKFVLYGPVQHNSPNLKSKIDKEDKEIYLNELCELENLVCTQTVYTSEID